MVPDTTEAYVEVSYTNIGECWWAELFHQQTGERLAWGNGKTRADSLRQLADDIEGEA